LLRLPCTQGREKNLRKNSPRNELAISVSFSTNFALLSLSKTFYVFINETNAGLYYMKTKRCFFIQDATLQIFCSSCWDTSAHLKVQLATEEEGPSPAGEVITEDVNNGHVVFERKIRGIAGK
jgi:hypothetical protein